MPVKKGDRVKVDYTGTLGDGTVFDSSEKHGKPLEFEAGSGQVIRGFDTAVMGMKKGEEKEITLQPDQAYGERNESLVKDVPRAQFPEKMEINAGMTLLLGLPDGQKFPATVKSVDGGKVMIDLNHPLAGKALTFKIKVVGVSSKKE